jgi:hypothetical protein
VRLNPRAPEGEILRLIKLAYVAAVSLAAMHYIIEVYPEYFFFGRIGDVDVLAFARRYVVKPLFASLTVFHFVLDSFYWKRSKNPDAVF